MATPPRLSVSNNVFVLLTSVKLSRPLKVRDGTRVPQSQRGRASPLCVPAPPPGALGQGQRGFRGDKEKPGGAVKHRGRRKRQKQRSNCRERERKEGWRRWERSQGGQEEVKATLVTPVICPQHTPVPPLQRAWLMGQAVLPLAGAAQ